MSSKNMFADNLRELRRKNGFTQAQLAELSGVSRRAIVHYENHAKRPTIDKVKKLSKALGISDEELLGQTDIPSRKKQPELPYKLMKKLRIIETLPIRDQNAIFQYIATVVERNQLKEEIQKKKK